MTQRDIRLLQVQRKKPSHANRSEPAERGVSALHVRTGEDRVEQGGRKQLHVALHSGQIRLLATSTVLAFTERGHNTAAFRMSSRLFLYILCVSQLTGPSFC